MQLKSNTKKILTGFGIGIGIILIASIIYFNKNKDKNKEKEDKDNDNLEKFKKMPCSHLAYCDLPNASKAQNNLKNIELLLENKIGMIEIDIQITKDKVPVLFHDKLLSAKTNGSGEIKNYNWSDIKNLKYDADKSQGITLLSDALSLLKKSKSKTYFQFDKCSPSEIKIISELGLLKGIEKKIICKNTSFIPSKEYIDAGVVYMPMIPESYVGKMNSEKVINEIVEKCKGFDFCELSFGTNDSLVLNGTLAKKLKQIGCSLLGVAITGIKTTNPNIYNSSWGDKTSAWNKYFNEIGCDVVMTDKPIAMKKYISSL